MKCSADDLIPQKNLSCKRNLRRGGCLLHDLYSHEHHKLVDWWMGGCIRQTDVITIVRNTYLMMVPCTCDKDDSWLRTVNYLKSVEIKMVTHACKWFSTEGSSAQSSNVSKYVHCTVPVTEIELSICHNCITPRCHSALQFFFLRLCVSWNVAQEFSLLSDQNCMSGGVCKGQYTSSLVPD